MGSEERPERPPRVDLRPHRLVPSRDEIEGAPYGGLNTIVGYVGASANEGQVRIYLDLSFGSYCEVASSDVVQTAPVDANDENSPTVVWVKSSAQVELVGRLTGDASFISGRIRKRFLPRASAEAVTLTNTFPQCSEVFFCPTEDPCSTPLCPPPESSSPWGCGRLV
jgi:hypothetical protein